MARSTQQSPSRRRFLISGARYAALAAAATSFVRAAPGRAEAIPQPAAASRSLIVNADDLGMCEAVDDGIIEAHRNGIVSSASLLVDAPHAAAGVQAAAAYPRLGLGLHVEFARGGAWLYSPENLRAVRDELNRQFDAFVRLVGRIPDHLDSHHHLHRGFNVAALFLELGARHRLVVRGLSGVTYVGSFYGQLTQGKSLPANITVDYLIGLIRKVQSGVTELSCHPGRAGPIPDHAYAAERALELATLTDPRVRDVLTEEGIRLINFGDYRRLAA